MGFLDRIRNRNAPEESQNSSEFLGTDLAGIGGESHTPSSAQDLSAREEIGAFAGPSPQEEARLYNPYEGLSTAVDPRILRSVYKLPSQPEFLFSEEATVHKRSWSENLTYYTGSGYLAGALMGGSLGAAQVMRPNQAIQGVESTRLKLNQFLNQSGRQGRVAGNALGILGLFFSTSESGLGYIFDGQTPGWANTLGAGFSTGAIFRSTRGPRAALVAGTFGLVCAGLLIIARENIDTGL